MLVRHGHTYVAGADVPAPALFRERVRRELIAAGFVNVSIRAVDEPTYNTVGRGTWTGPDTNIDLPPEVIWHRDVTPPEAREEPAAPPPAAGPAPVGPAAPAPSPVTPSPPPAATRRRRRRAAPPAAPDRTVTVVSLVVGGVLAGWLYKLKKAGFWDRPSW